MYVEGFGADNNSACEDALDTLDNYLRQRQLTAEDIVVYKIEYERETMVIVRCTIRFRYYNADTDSQ
jgi:hypothetical protein